MLNISARVVDSTHIELSEPIGLETGSRVVISFATLEDEGADRELWLAAAASSLASAYGENEPEYASTLVKEANPDYEA